MENMLIYELQSESKSEGRSQQHEEEPSVEVATEKQEQTTQTLETKTIHVHSASSDDSPKKLLKSESELVFYDEQLIRSTTSMDVDETKRVFLKRQAEEQSSQEEECSQYEDQVMELEEVQSLGSPNMASTKSIRANGRSKVLTVRANRSIFVKQVIAATYKLSCLLSLQRNFLGMVSRFMLRLCEGGQFLLSAKKQVFSLMSTFTISSHSREINKRNDSFLGVLQANFIGTEFRLVEVVQEMEELKMIVSYEKNIAGFNGPRMFSAVKMNPEAKTDHSLLSALMQNEKSKLVQMKTAVPILKKGKYRLDFEKKAKIPSAKNFILEREEGEASKNAILFCKVQEDVYLVEISYPLSVLEAFAICLSSLDAKMMVN